MKIEAAPAASWETRRSISLTVEDGPVVEIVGSTHRGKSLKVDRLRLIYAPEQGRWAVQRASLAGLMLRRDGTIGKIQGADHFTGRDGTLRTDLDWLRQVAEYHRPVEPAPTSPTEPLTIDPAPAPVPAVDTVDTDADTLLPLL
ncbi:hypothetical protein [Streptacidiphilus sp. EB103A]|uniref:hypothetical protein n=1 Tax=Streptacidiphilus sp. EB103A TaxID=3156275 RepID=UPI003512F2E6